MPAVTQQIPNFLGGVSRQTDDKKLANQLTECVNGYPDPTFGLLKRPGMKHIEVLKRADGTAFNKSELADAAWFFIDRAAAGSYIGAIKGTNLYIWTAADGTFCTVTNNGTGYLTGTSQNDYHFRSIQDTTIITNKTVTTAMDADNTFVAESQGTLKLKTLTSGDEFRIKMRGVSGGTQYTETVTATGSSTFDDFLTGRDNSPHELLGGVEDLIQRRFNANDSNFSGKWYLNSYANSITIRRTTGSNAILIGQQPPTNATYKYFELRAEGGFFNSAIESFQDDVTNVSELPVGSFHNHTVKILNSDSADDDYYLKFVAENGTDGKGYWQETLARDVSPGLNNATMPHELSNTGATTFTFGPITYKDRLVGDDNTNPKPSFVGKKINSTFFYNNRFGMLSEDNVIFSVSNDNYNFFAKSALTQIDSDPIDLNVSSVRPVKLFDVLPSPQGLLLFSERQQFQVYTTESGVLTPTTSVVRALSNYEMAENIRPVDFGTTSAFVSRVPGYSKLFTMTLRDVQQPPVVVDISKAVLEWLPNTVDDLTVSPPNSLIMLVDRDTKYLYLYRFYNNGKEDLFQSWVKWELPADVQAAKILNDAVTVVTQYEDEYAVGSIELDELPSGDIIATSDSFTGNVPLDMATRPVSPANDVDAVVYDSTNDLTKIYVPYTPIDDKDAVMLLTVPTADDGTDAELDSDQGYWAKGIERIESGTGYHYFEVKGDFTDYSDGIVVGYGYDLEATLPKFYLQRQGTGADYTAALTIARVKLSVGRTGAIQFKLKADGSNEWKDVQHTAEGDKYQGDTNPVIQERVFTLPIHQRNTNFELKVTSNFPYPVSLVSMMWEGNYSQRFYRRA